MQPDHAAQGGKWRHQQQATHLDHQPDQDEEIEPCRAIRRGTAGAPEPITQPAGQAAPECETVAHDDESRDGSENPRLDANGGGLVEGSFQIGQAIGWQPGDGGEGEQYDRTHRHAPGPAYTADSQRHRQQPDRAGPQQTAVGDEPLPGRRRCEAARERDRIREVGLSVARHEARLPAEEDERGHPSRGQHGASLAGDGQRDETRHEGQQGRVLGLQREPADEASKQGPEPGPFALAGGEQKTEGGRGQSERGQIQHEIEGREDRGRDQCDAQQHAAQARRQLLGQPADAEDEEPDEGEEPELPEQWAIAEGRDRDRPPVGHDRRAEDPIGGRGLVIPEDLEAVGIQRGLGDLQRVAMEGGVVDDEGLGGVERRHTTGQDQDECGRAACRRRHRKTLDHVRRPGSAPLPLLGARSCQASRTCSTMLAVPFQRWSRCAPARPCRAAPSAHQGSPA